MKKFAEIALISVIGIALTGCDGNKKATEVTYDALLATGINGYKINVDIDDGIEQFNSIDYYFCSDSIMGYDYFAQNSSSGEWQGEEPDFDYGDLDSEDPTYLDFFTDSGNPPSPYSVISEEMVLKEGETYGFDLWANEDIGTVYIRSISDFDCSTIMEPIDIMEPI